MWWWNLVPILVVALLGYVIVRARRQPLWAEAYRRLGQSRTARVAITVILLFGVVAFLDSISWKDGPNAEPLTILDRCVRAAGVQEERTYSAPLAKVTTGEPTPHKLLGWHLMGTDGTGKDVLYETLRGCKTAMIIGGLTSLIAVPLALIFGMVAGYFGKFVDDGIQYVYTVLDSVPSILLLVSLLLVLGRGVPQLCIALGVTSWVGLCRLSRGETLKHREREYVRAARALGASPARILFRHILPNLLPIVIISTTLGFSGLVLSETILSYIGIGVDAGTGSWGNMIDAARIELAREPAIWWSLTSASIALFLLVWAFNIFGDALRDAIDPRLRSS